MAYTRQNDDKAFRRVNLKTSAIPQFQPFNAAAQMLECHEDEVLEVQREDGSTTVIDAPNKKLISFLKTPPNYFLIPENVPTAHLGICKPDCPSVQYMLPDNLPAEGHYKRVLVPAGANAELCGDIYFNAAYQLSNQN